MPFFKNEDTGENLILPPVRQSPGPLLVEAYGSTHQGRRLVNEDAFACVVGPERPDWLEALLIVSDGIGGRQNGHIASTMAVRSVKESALATPVVPPPHDFEEWLISLIKKAGRDVFDVAQEDPRLAQMGCTLTIAAVVHRMVYVASLGDSRAYLHRGRRLIQLTHDDWIRASYDLVPGVEEAAGPQNVTVVNQAVGWEGDLEPQSVSLEIGEGDVILLCTDGISDAFGSRQLEVEINRGRRRLDILVRRLLEQAASIPDADNCTAVAARIGAG